MEKFICIHGHFYQPPRENPWLEAVELQDSAHPYHDWNERITSECYAPNAFARVLDDEGRIERIVSNYSKISFNFGPTLLAWMKEKAPDIHQAIIDSDKESQKRFSGHGSAMAQGYNHLIMPLATRRDKYTQALWGIRDFEFRFGRQPEGMWLPECAVDNESLEVLAELGIRFTILSPFQANRIRPLSGPEWDDVNGGRVDPTRPYKVQLASGRSIAVFFYDGPVAQAVAFERLLGDGPRFASRLTDAFDESRTWDQLVNIATDGESYGHHHRYGEMALAYALRVIERKKLARLTNYGEFLELHPPTHEVEIHQPSAWSCPHGVDRWVKNCGCSSGGHSHWNQEWRQPLREALDWLRDQLAPRFESRAKGLLNDPWAARDDYIEVICDRSPDQIAKFFERHASRPLSEADQVQALRLLEMQRHAMLMYTSCGWFFDEISGIETVQVIQYAARCIQLAADPADEDLEPGFLEILGRARSNIREFGDGRQVYETFAKPAIADRERVGAHYAISSLFQSYPERTRIYSFTIVQEDRKLLTAGNTRLAIGRVKVTFEITRSSDTIFYGVLYMGEHNLNCGVRQYQGEEAYNAVVKDMTEAFERADFPEIIRQMDRHFGESNYSLKNLFRDEQRQVLNQILTSTREDVYKVYRSLTDRFTPLLRFLASLQAPAPRALQMAQEFVLNSDLRKQIAADLPEIEHIRALLAEAEREGVALEKETLGYELKNRLDRILDQLLKAPEDAGVLRSLLAAAELAKILPFEVNLWKPQNFYHVLRTTVAAEMAVKASTHDPDATTWMETFMLLAEPLGFHVDRR